MMPNTVVPSVGSTVSCYSLTHVEYSYQETLRQLGLNWAHTIAAIIEPSALGPVGCRRMFVMADTQHGFQLTHDEYLTQIRHHDRAVFSTAWEQGSLHMSYCTGWHVRTTKLNPLAWTFWALEPHGLKGDQRYIGVQDLLQFRELVAYAASTTHHASTLSGNPPPRGRSNQSSGSSLPPALPQRASRGADDVRSALSKEIDASQAIWA